MADIVIKCETAKINLSPVLFQKSAKEYLKACLDFEKPGNFSCVPFFLCCRSIELALKAKHLESKTQKQVKDLYSHNLVTSYATLDNNHKNLLPDEEALLTEASKIYSAKEFEYLNVFDAVTAYKRFPDLNRLIALAKKIVNYDA
jgi:hypothetical protein